MAENDRPYIAILPRPPQVHDEVIIKAKLKDDANVFSVNFCLESVPNPSFIAYHFKTIFETNTVVHNHKSGSWNTELTESNTWIDGPGSRFVLTFLFTESDIMVYTDDENRCYQYQFDHKFDISHIKAIALWDDLDYVEEIIFRYKPAD